VDSGCERKRRRWRRRRALEFAVDNKLDEKGGGVAVRAAEDEKLERVGGGGWK
jgi:hypothetical protein